MLEDVKDAVDMVLIDNFEATCESTRYLLDCGHRQIGVIVGPKDIYTSQQRLLGYDQAFVQTNIPFNRDLVVYSDYTVQGGYSQTKWLLQNFPEMTALFVTNYEMTLGAVLALNEANVRIPEQLSLIGFDNLQLSQVIQPRLTLVAQPLQEIGQHVARQLLCRLKDHSARPETIMLQAKMLMGASVKTL